MSELSELPALWAWDRRRPRDMLGKIRAMCEKRPSLPLACAAAAAGENHSLAARTVDGEPTSLVVGTKQLLLLLLLLLLVLG